MTPIKPTGTIIGGKVSDPADRAFYKFWYSHMKDEQMTGMVVGVAHATARYIWDAARTAPPASQEAPTWAKGYLSGTVVSDFNGPKVTLRFNTTAEAEAAFDAFIAMSERAGTEQLDPGIEYARAHRDSGFSCPSCCAKQGEPCRPDCPTHMEPK